MNTIIALSHNQMTSKAKLSSFGHAPIEVLTHIATIDRALNLCAGNGLPFRPALGINNRTVARFAYVYT